MHNETAHMWSSFTGDSGQSLTEMRHKQRNEIRQTNAMAHTVEKWLRDGFSENTAQCLIGLTLIIGTTIAEYVA